MTCYLCISDIFKVEWKYTGTLVQRLMCSQGHTERCWTGMLLQASQTLPPHAAYLVLLHAKPFASRAPRYTGSREPSALCSSDTGVGLAVTRGGGRGHQGTKTSSCFAAAPSSVSVGTSPGTASHRFYALSKENANQQGRVQKLTQGKKIWKEDDMTSLHKRLMRGNGMRWRLYGRLIEGWLRVKGD